MSLIAEAPRTPEDLLINKQLATKALQVLTEREREVVVSRVLWGMTLAETGKESWNLFNGRPISGNRVLGIERRALRRMRSALWREFCPGIGKKAEEERTKREAEEMARRRQAEEAERQRKHLAQLDQIGLSRTDPQEEEYRKVELKLEAAADAGEAQWIVDTRRQIKERPRDRIALLAMYYRRARVT